MPLHSDRRAKLLAIDSISAAGMMNELRLTSPDSTVSEASVGALLRSFFPAATALYSHADAIIALSTLIDGEQRVHSSSGAGSSSYASQGLFEVSARTESTNAFQLRIFGPGPGLLPVCCR